MPKEDMKYRGLMNQGATCYLNSVLQVLLMTKEFREAVERHPNKDPECIEYHLTNLFTQYPHFLLKITQKLGINNVHEQRDAAEYFEKIFNLMSNDASRIFHGKLTHTNKCSACGRDDDTNDPFWHLPLALVDSSSEKYSVVDGIEKFFNSSEFSGENQMYCDKCEDKADATLKSVMKHHPDVLMLLLKRFEFDYSYMAYVKINCVVDVPRILQIPENQTYELYAVVDHFGDLRSGHYTATIKSDDDGSWYNFNDANVCMLDKQPFQVDNTEESKSAYLLFYKKKKMDAADTCTQDIREMFTPERLPSDISDNEKQYQDDVKIREKQDSGEEVEVSNDTPEAVSTYRYEESRDKERFGSRGVEMLRDHSKEMGRNTRADGKAERKESLTLDTDQNVDNQNSDNDAQSRPHDDFARDEPSEKKRNSSTKHFTKDVLQYGQEVEEERERNVEGDEEGKSGDVQLASGSGKLFTRLTIPKGDQGSEQGNSNVLYESPEQQREGMKEVTGDIAQQRRDVEHRIGTSETKYNSEEDVDEQNNERLDDVRHEDQEHKQKSGQVYGLERVSMVRQGDEEVIKMNTQDTTEILTLEGLSLDISDKDKEHQYAVKIREKHEGCEELASAEAVSTDRYEEKDSKDNEGLDCVRQKQEVEEERERNVEGDEEGTSGDVQLASGSGKLFTRNEHRIRTSKRKYDSEVYVEDQVRHEEQECKQKSGQVYGLEHVGMVRQGDTEVIKMKENKDKRQKEISNTGRQVHSRQVFVDKQGEEKRGGKGHKKQKRGDDKCRGTSVGYCGEGVEDQNVRRLDDDKQNRRRERQDQKSRHKDDSVERLTREEELSDRD